MGFSGHKFRAGACFHDTCKSRTMAQDRTYSAGSFLRALCLRVTQYLDTALHRTLLKPFGRLSWILLLICLSGAAKAGQLVFSDPATGVEQEYSVDDMRNMPVTELTTSTPWTEGVQHFVGVPLSEFLRSLSGEYTLHLKAVNDYSVSMSAELVASTTSIIAFERNGALMSVRDKGPFWLIFPFDDDERYLTESMMSRSIWQLSRIEVQR